jgi:hypothetical protein
MDIQRVDQGKGVSSREMTNYWRMEVRKVDVDKLSKYSVDILQRVSFPISYRVTS